MITTVDHKAAESSNAVERYLLGEGSSEERAAFEAHFFECRICGENVRTGTMFVDNARAVMREEPRANAVVPAWFGWLRNMLTPAFAVPAFAAIALCGIVGYQNLVTIPRLRQPQLLSSLVVAPLARDAGPVIAIDRKNPMFNVNFDVDSPRAYPAYKCTFENQTGAPVLTIDSPGRGVSSFTLGVLLPTSKFPDGAYAMTVRPASEPSVVVQRYTFTVRAGESN